MKKSCLYSCKKKFSLTEMRFSNICRLSVVEERFEHLCKRSNKDITKSKHLAKRNAALRQNIKVRINEPSSCRKTNVMVVLRNKTNHSLILQTNMIRGLRKSQI